MTDLTGEAQGLSRVLAELLPYLQSDECPVCGRSFSEVSSDPLAARLASRVAQLTEQAGHLESLSKEMVRVDAAINSANRESERYLSESCRQSLSLP
jgi:exonuclease SbcC